MTSDKSIIVTQATVESAASSGSGRGSRSSFHSNRSRDKSETSDDSSKLLSTSTGDDGGGELRWGGGGHYSIVICLRHVLHLGR